MVVEMEVVVEALQKGGGGNGTTLGKAVTPAPTGTVMTTGGPGRATQLHTKEEAQHK